MSERGDYKKLIAAALANGWTYDKRGAKHHCMISPTGVKVWLPQNQVGSTRHSIKWFRRDLRKNGVSV